jgi:hypothetical protein
VDDRVQVAHRARREAAREPLSVEARQGVRRESLQACRADPWRDVVADVGGVALIRRGAVLPPLRETDSARARSSRPTGALLRRCVPAPLVGGARPRRPPLRRGSEQRSSRAERLPLSRGQVGGDAEDDLVSEGVPALSCKRPRRAAAGTSGGETLISVSFTRLRGIPFFPDVFCRK